MTTNSSARLDRHGLVEENDLQQEKTASRSRSFTADDIVAELMPAGFDWQRLVRTYPVPALALAAATGFVLGRGHGTGLMSALGAFAVGEVTKNIHSFLGDEPR